MSRQILLRRLNKDGLFETATQSDSYKVDLDASDVASGISNFALTCIQERALSKRIIGLGNFNPKRAKGKKHIMNTAQVCILGVYITLYGEHKINIGQLTTDFREKTGCYNESINYFNKLFAEPVRKNVRFEGPVRKKVRMAERHAGGRMALAYFWIGLNAVADLIKETFKMRSIGLFEKETLLREYLIQLGIAQLNVFYMLEGRKSSENEVLYFWMTEHQTTLNFSMRGNSIYISRSIQHLSPIKENGLKHERNATTPHELPVFAGDRDITLDAVVTETPLIPKVRTDTNNQSDMVSAVNDNITSESFIIDSTLDDKRQDERQDANHEIMARDAQTSDFPADKVIKKEAVNDIAGEQPSSIIEISEKFGEHESPVKEDLPQDNEIIADKIEVDTPKDVAVNKTIVPQRPRVPITANTNTSPLSDIGEVTVSNDKNSTDTASQAKVKKPMFKGLGKSPINFDML